MSILTNDQIEMLNQHTTRKVAAVNNALRIAMWGAKGETTPPGLTRLVTPQDRQMWQEHLQIQASKEQSGHAPGDIATAALEHPDVAAAMNAPQIPEAPGGIAP